MREDYKEDTLVRMHLVMIWKKPFKKLSIWLELKCNSPLILRDGWRLVHTLIKEFCPKMKPFK
jgi:hypothetical protein